jgi:type VI secretion system VasD/TssJ family lipoprotein
LTVALLAASSMSGAGCAGAKPTCKVPDTVELELESSDRVNRDEKGESLPTVIRLYQLVDLSAMQSASFDDIWERSDEVLGETKAGKPIVITIYPGQIMVQRFKRNPAADFLVGAAVFRRPIGGAWRTIDEWPLTGDPCAEQDDDEAAPKLKQLRVRMFLKDYRIESTNNFAALPKRTCPPGVKNCRGQTGEAPDELQEELRNRRLRTFEEDPSAPTPTIGDEPGGGSGPSKEP